MNDLRYATRQLLKNPGFTAVAVLTLALGIGATTVIFSVVNAVLLQPLAYDHEERLVRIYTDFPAHPNGGLKRNPLSQPEFLDLRREGRLWDAIEGWQKSGVNLAGENEPVRATAAFVTGGMLDLLGVPPLHGRLIAPADDEPGAPLTANISFGVWQRAFGGDRGIVGREILLNGSKCTVVGVMPEDFRFPPGDSDASEVWAPIQINPARPRGRGSHNLSVVGRLKSGVTIEQSRGELASLVKQAGETASAAAHHFDPEEHTLSTYGWRDAVVHNVKPALRMLLGAVCFVLLIACVNVGNLLLARAEGRQREIGLRGALGASHSRLARQFVTEGFLLSFLGTALGLLLACGGLQLVKTASAASIPRSSEIGLNAWVLFFATGICVVSGLVFGLTPLMHVAKRNLQSTLKSAAASTTGTSSAQFVRQGLAVSQLALALTLLIGTGLMLRAFWNLQQVHAGFTPGHVITASISLPRPIYPTDASAMNFWSRLQERITALPGAESAALTSDLPPHKGAEYDYIEVEGYVPADGKPIDSVDFYQAVSQDYFKTFGIRLIEGRVFDERDRAGAPDVAVINQTTAGTFWKNESPIGRRLRRAGAANPWCTVIGVVDDVKNHGLHHPTGTEVYFAPGQSYADSERTLFVAVRSRLTPSTIINGLRAEVRALDSGLPLARIRTMDEVMSAAQSRPRFLTLLLTLFSGIALLLAAIGIYGVIAYSVAQRTKEFGVRMALGAQRRDVLGIVLGRGMLLALIGIALGLAGAFALTRFLSTLLFGVAPTDPLTFAVVSIVLAVVACLATYIPARRATKVNPIVALRYE